MCGTLWYDSAAQHIAAGDKETVERLGQLCQVSNNRQRVVAGVVDRLQSELATFAEFIDSIALRRPPCMSFIAVNYNNLRSH